MIIQESKKQLFKTRQDMIFIIDRLQESIVHRCILEGCVYGYEGVHKEPEKECLYCKNPRREGVSPNAWRSPGKSIEEMLSAKKENEEKANNPQEK